MRLRAVRQAEVGRLAHAIAAGGDIPALVTAMQGRERRRSHVRNEVDALERLTVRRDQGEVERVLDIMREALADWQGLLRQETGPARRALQTLLQGRLVFVLALAAPGFFATRARFSADRRPPEHRRGSSPFPDA